MKQPVFYGIATALITPFDRDGAPDFEVFGEMIDRQIRAGTDALVVCGTTGESATLREKERLALIEYAVWRTAKRIPVIAGTGTNCTEQSITLTRSAQRLGADAILAVCPYYVRPTQEGLIAHFTALADCSSLPVVVYNVPKRTGCEAEEATLIRLSEHPNVCGLKQANGSVCSAERIVAACGDALPVYSGDDALTVPMMSVGAQGVISVASNLIPGQMHDLCRLVQTGDLQGAAREQIRLLPLIDALFSLPNPIPVKACMELLGYPEQTLRLPLVAAEGEKKAVLHAIAKPFLQE